MKLKSQLRSASLEALRSIADFWSLDPESDETLRDPIALGEYLYPRLQASTQFKHAFERLEVGERELVYFLALHGGELPVEEFRRRTGLHDEEKMNEASERLGQRGFVWRESISDESHRYDIVGLPEPFVRLIELPPYWEGFLGHFLQRLNLSELRAIVRHSLGKRYDGRKKQVLVHYVRDHLLDPQRLRECLERHNADEQQLFDQILNKNGACVWRDLLESRTQKKFNHVRAECLQSLTERSGLVFVSRPSSNHYDHLVMTPRDLQHMIHNDFRRDERTLAELSRSDRPRRSAGAVGSRPNVILDNSQNILRDFVIVMAYVLHHHIKVLNNGGIGRNDLKKIIPLLSHNKTVKYVSFLSLFAMSEKLLIPVGDHWRVSKKAEGWLEDSRRCFREIYDYWLNTNEWNEEFVDGDVVHVDHYPQNLISITELRKLILRVLSNSPVESWIDFETFCESLLPQVAIEIPGRFDHAPTERSNRPTALIMESILGEALYWFGLLTLGVPDLDAAAELGSRTVQGLGNSDVLNRVSSSAGADPDYLFCFKVSATGRGMFDGDLSSPSRLFAKDDASDLPYADTVAVFTVQPNLEIVTPPDLDLSCFYRLLHFTEVKKVDIMTTLTISRDSLRMGMERGLSGEQIVDFLAECSRKELPETVTHLVDECISRHGEVDVGLAGGYIVAADRLHVEELRSNSKIQRYIKDVFADRVIMLNRTADIDKLVKELQKIGFMPRVASETLHVTREELFHITLRPEELYQLLAVLNFAQDLEGDSPSAIFEDRVSALIERLSNDAKGDYNPDYYVEPLVKKFQLRHEKLTHKQRDEEKRRLKKQVNRLLTRVPRRREPIRYKGENPTSDPAGVVKLIKFAIEHEMQVKIHYQRSTGEEIDEVIEPESLQGSRIYAFCPQDDEHHIYTAKRIMKAAL